MSVWRAVVMCHVACCCSYFVLPNEGMTMVEEEARMEPGAGGDFCMAHNGWVINANPMENFAEPGQYFVG